ncbi:MAG: hypothetical protein Q8R91_01430 [Candidatus Omnitrophota bacterium]|nr:hypothetical protein [Candidatus Omnitrophota bacterium]
MVERRHNERGVVLGVVILSSIAFSVAAFAMLTMAMSGHFRSEQHHRKRLEARYAAEAGVVWAMQQIWTDPDILANPLKCFAANPDVTIEAFDVDIIAEPCPGEDVSLEANVQFSSL